MFKTLPDVERMAEREGFEPSVPRKGHNGFRDRPDRPLWHLSAKPRNLPIEGARRLPQDLATSQPPRPGSQT
jgi:hypothetical protein